MLKIYDEFLEDETILALKDRTYRLHVSALVYCSRNLTDGEVTDKAVRVLQAILGYSPAKHIAELVAASVWVPLDQGGWLIRNYLEFNPDAVTVKKERAKGRERMRKLREKRACAHERADERNGEGSPERNGARAPGRDGATPPQSLPVLSLKEPKAVVLTSSEQRPTDESIAKTIELSLQEAS